MGHLPRFVCVWVLSLLAVFIVNSVLHTGRVPRFVCVWVPSSLAVFIQAKPAAKKHTR
jgi:hypothetical protein